MLGWPKISFRFVYKMVQLNEIFAQTTLVFLCLKYERKNPQVLVSEFSPKACLWLGKAKGRNVFCPYIISSSFPRDLALLNAPLI